MPVAIYKDYDMDVTGFFNKFFMAACNGFKLESKKTAAVDTLYFNPHFVDGTFKGAFHYDFKALNGTVKATHTVAQTGAANVQLNYTTKCSFGAQMVQFTYGYKLADVTAYTGELITKASPDALTLWTKTNFAKGSCATVFSASVQPVDGLALGGQASFNCVPKVLGGYQAGAQYKTGGITFAGKYEVAAGQATAGFVAPALVKDIFGEGKNLDLAAQVVQNAKGVTAQFGAGTKCPLTGFNVRVKGNLAGNYGVALFRALPKGYTVGVGVEGSVSTLGKCPCDKLSCNIAYE